MANKNASTVLQNYIFDALRYNIIFWAAEFNIIDHLLERPMTAEELGETTKLHVPTLKRLLQYLVAHGLLDESKQKIFSVTPFGSALSENEKSGVKFQFIAIEKMFIDAARNFGHALRTGENAFEHFFGMKFFDFLAQHPNLVKPYAKAMNEYSDTIDNSILEIYNFSQFKHVVDVGGNNGSLLIKILMHTNNVSGTVFDLDFVVVNAQKAIDDKQLNSRCNTVSGSFLDSIPVEGDCYTVKFVLHDWNDEKCVQILRNIANRMKRDSKLLIMEKLVPETGLKDVDYATQSLDFTTLISADGKERKVSEFEELLKLANLRMTRVFHAKEHHFGIVEAVLNA